MKHTSVLAVGDSHFPFARRRSVVSLIALARKLKPKIIIQLGDLYDLYSYSRFARSYNLLTPVQEIKKGRRDAEEFWSSLKAAAGPKVECHQLIGNHDERLIKKTMGLLPELEHLVHEVNHLWRFPGVQTQLCERDELMIDGVCYMHGYRKHGTHVAYNQMSTVVGHLHLGGVVYQRLKNKTIWELNAGFIADPASVPMSYSRQAKISKVTQGVGYIDGYGPRFIALD